MKGMDVKKKIKFSPQSWVSEILSKDPVLWNTKF